MILLVDADSIPFTVCHNKKDEPTKTLDDCIKGANSFLSSLCNGASADKVHLFFTLSKCFRYSIDANYKAKRTGIRPDYFYNIRDYLVDTYNGVSHLDLEADDLLNIYKNKYRSESISTLIYSKDKDVKNLVGSHYNMDSNTINLVMSSHADEYFWKSMIIGDQVDNIKGIPKKGKVFADNLYEECLHRDDEKLTFQLFRGKILTEYINYFGELKGVEEFYRNYKCLKILDSYEGIEFQEPIESKDIYARTLGVVGE